MINALDFKLRLFLGTNLSNIKLQWHKWVERILELYSKHLLK